MNKKEFEEKYVNDNKVVHCNTDEKAIRLLELAYDFGYKWCDNKKFINEDNSAWTHHGESTCYNLDIKNFGSCNYYKKIGYTIVEFDENDFIKNKTNLNIDIISERYTKLAGILNLKLDEEFLISDSKFIYKITSYGVYWKTIEKEDLYSKSTFIVDYLLTSTIIKLPFKPTNGQVYYYPTFHYKDRQWDSKMWNDREVDERIFNFFGCYRTKEEAENKAKELWGI